MDKAEYDKTYQVLNEVYSSFESVTIAVGESIYENLSSFELLSRNLKSQEKAIAKL